MPGLVPEATGTPGGAGMADPFGMANSLMEFQNRANQNRLFQSQFMANQALGEVVAHSGSLEEGVTQAMQNPLIAGFATQGLANLRSMQNLELQTGEIRQRLSTSGYENTLQAGLAAAQDPLNYDKYFKAGLEAVDPSVRGRVTPMIKAVEDAIGQKISKYDMSKPDQVAAAKRDITALVGGAFIAGGGDPSHLTPYFGTVGMTPEGFAVKTPPILGQNAGAGGVVGGGTAPAAPAAPAGQGPAGAEPTVTNSSSGEQYKLSTGDSSHYMETGADGKPLVDIYGNMHLKPNLVDADRKLQDEHATTGLEKYNGAKNMLGSLAQMDASVDELTAKGGFTVPGFLGTARGQIANAMETIMHITGKQFTGDAKDLPAANADIATINKWHNALTFQLKGMFEGSGARGLGVLMEASGAVPGMENTPLSFKVLTAGLKALANWEVGRYEYKDAWMQDRRSGGSLLGSDRAYNSQSSPLDAAKAELGKLGVTLDHGGQMVFKDNDALKNAYDTGLFGKPGSPEAVKAFKGMYKNMHPEEY